MRLLVRCSQCLQKYDATKRGVGSLFHCRCGSVVEVQQPQSHEASVVHCAACGAPREKGSRACGFCGGDFTIHELDLNTVCPGCLARVSDRARYCHHCATPLSAQAVAGDEQPFFCPACEDRQLAGRHLESISTAALECQVCAGLWIGLEAFHDLLTSEERGDRGTSVSHRRPTAPPGNVKRYRKCPECRQLMVPRQVGKSGIVVDICGQHGMWLDCDELSHLIAWMRAGRLTVVQEMVGQLKGSPDTIRKRLASAAEAKSLPLPTPSGYAGSYEDWSDWGGNRHRTNVEWMIEIGIPLLAVLGSALAKMFLK
jgi:Zn-finger nucleic acid-binding protein